MLTLNTAGIDKLLNLFSDSLDHITYDLNNQSNQADIYKTEIDGSSIKIYAFIDDTSPGTISNVSIIDADNKIIATAETAVIKPDTKGFYVIFTYQINESEVSN